MKRPKLPTHTATLTLVTEMLPSSSIELRAYIDTHDARPFETWFDGLDAGPAAKISIALSRLEHANFSNAKSVGSGVHEYKIDSGPGYRIYFGKDGATVVILLGGGTKKRQPKDIASAAKERWADYKRRKKDGEPYDASDT